MRGVLCKSGDPGLDSYSSVQQEVLVYEASDDEELYCNSAQFAVPLPASTSYASYRMSVPPPPLPSRSLCPMQPQPRMTTGSSDCFYLDSSTSAQEQFYEATDVVYEELFSVATATAQPQKPTGTMLCQKVPCSKNSALLSTFGDEDRREVTKADAERDTFSTRTLVWPSKAAPLSPRACFERASVPTRISYGETVEQLSIAAMSEMCASPVRRQRHCIPSRVFAIPESEYTSTAARTDEFAVKKVVEAISDFSSSVNPQLANHARIMTTALNASRNDDFPTLYFNKGDQLEILETNHTCEYWLARCTRTKMVGYVPYHFTVPLEGTNNAPWFHGDIGNVEASRRLQSACNAQKGTFLIHLSDGEGLYTLSVLDDAPPSGQVVHYAINNDDAGKYVLFPGYEFQFLTRLVFAYTTVVSELCCQLTVPCQRPSKPTGNRQSTIQSKVPFVLRKVPTNQLQAVMFASCKISFNDGLQYRYWDLQALHTVDVDYVFCRQKLENAGIKSLGARAEKDICQLLATLIVIFRVLCWTRSAFVNKYLSAMLQTVVDGRCFVGSDIQVVHRSTLSCAARYCLRVDSQRPLVYSMLQLGASWSDVVLDFLGDVKSSPENIDALIAVPASWEPCEKII